MRSLRPSPRKKEVACLLAHGYTNKQIAAKLCIHKDTVDHHIRDLFEIAGVQNRTQLAIWALKNRYLTLRDIKLPQEEI